jgi:hypothetical protein
MSAGEKTRASQWSLTRQGVRGLTLATLWCLGAMRSNSASGHVTAGRPQGPIHAREGRPASLVMRRDKRGALVGLSIQLKPLPIHVAAPRGLLSGLRRRSRGRRGGVWFEPWLQSKPGHRRVMRRWSECVWRTVQIGSVRERAIGTLIDRVPRIGDRIENEPCEQRHNQHVGTVRRWWSEIYETLVSGSGPHAPRKRDRKTRKILLVAQSLLYQNLTITNIQTRKGVEF